MVEQINGNLPNELLVIITVDEYKTGNVLRVDELDPYINAGYSVKSITPMQKLAAYMEGGSFTNGYTLFINLVKSSELKSTDYYNYDDKYD